MGARFGGIGAPVARISPHFDTPARDMEPIIGPGKGEPQTIPALGGASCDAVPMKPRDGIVFLVCVRFFPGEAWAISRDDLSPRAIGQARRHDQEPGIGVCRVNVDHEPPRIGTPLRLFPIPHWGVNLRGASLPQQEAMNAQTLLTSSGTPSKLY